MKLKKYLATLNEMVKANPALLELEVIYSADDEGNYYSKVHYTPSPGKFNDNGYGGEFDPDTESKKPNAICLN